MYVCMYVCMYVYIYNRICSKRSSIHPLMQSIEYPSVVLTKHYRVYGGKEVRTSGNLFDIEEYIDIEIDR